MVHVQDNFLNMQVFPTSSTSYYAQSTNLRCRPVVWSSISENDDNVRDVTAVTCRWSQHRSTNVGKRSSRVGATSWVSQRGDSWLDWGYWRVGAQVKAGSNVWRIGDKTHTCISAVNIQSADKVRQKRLHQTEIPWTDTSWLVQHEYNVRRTVRWRWRRHNCILCKHFNANIIYALTVLTSM